MIQNININHSRSKVAKHEYVRTKLLGMDEFMPIMVRTEARRPTVTRERGWFEPFEISELQAGIALGLFIAICAMAVVAFFL